MVKSSQRYGKLGRSAYTKPLVSCSVLLPVFVVALSAAARTGLGRCCYVSFVRFITFYVMHAAANCLNAQFRAFDRRNSRCGQVQAELMGIWFQMQNDSAFLCCARLTPAIVQSTSFIGETFMRRSYSRNAQTFEIVSFSLFTLRFARKYFLNNLLLWCRFFSRNSRFRNSLCPAISEL